MTQYYVTGNRPCLVIGARGPDHAKEVSRKAGNRPGQAKFVSEEKAEQHNFSGRVFAIITCPAT